MAPGLRLVDEGALARREREFWRRVGRKIECETRAMRGRVDGEVERGAAIECADLDDLIAARNGGCGRRQHRQLGEIDVSLIAPRVREPDWFGDKHLPPSANRQPRRLPSGHPA